jgi:hypothetical protein
MSHPTTDEREAYDDLCEAMGEETSMTGLLEYVSWHRKIEEGFASAPANAKGEGHIFKNKPRAPRKKVGAPGMRNRGVLQPHERAVRAAINKETGAHRRSLDCRCLVVLLLN